MKKYQWMQHICIIFLWFKKRAIIAISISQVNQQPNMHCTFNFVGGGGYINWLKPDDIASTIAPHAVAHRTQYLHPIAQIENINKIRREEGSLEEKKLKKQQQIKNKKQIEPKKINKYILFMRTTFDWTTDIGVACWHKQSSNSN